MSQASATRLIPKLKFKLHDRRNLRNVEGPKGRHDKIKKTITALFKHERIELNYHKADESRGYAERLLSDAIRYGDTHKPTMEMATYWIIDKTIIHKLFKVLAPKYKDFRVSYTKLWRAPRTYPGYGFSKCVLELRDNIYPPLGADKSHQKNLIHNVLLEEAKKVYRKEKALKAQERKVEEQGTTKIDENHLDVKVNAQVNAGVDVNVESDKLSSTDYENKLPNKDCVQADSENANEVKEKNEVNSLVEKKLDLSKMKITEEKQVEFSGKQETK